MWSPHALAKRPYDLRAPLRNRTLDLLLTIEGQRGRLRPFRHVNGPTAGWRGRLRTARVLPFPAVPPPPTPRLAALPAGNPGPLPGSCHGAATLLPSAAGGELAA